MATPNIVPRADGEGGLGSSSKYWGSAYIDLIYVGAGKIGRDADNLLDFSSDNLIYFRLGAGNEFLMANNMFGPAASDGAALGNSTYKWSDLFLASGAVINFDNGNVTLTHSSNALTLADSDVLAFGAGSDLQLSHDATNSHIANYNGDLKITNNANDKDIVFLCDDGSGGNTAYLTLDGGLGYTVAEKNIRFQDSVRARFGTSNDFDIYHNGTNSVIDNYTNNLEIRNFADDGDIIFKSDDGSGGTTEYFRLDGGNEGSYFSKHVHLIDSVQLRIGNGNDAAFYHDSVDTYLANATGDFYIQNTANDKDITFQSDNGAGSIATYFFLDGSSATHDGSATTNLFTNWPDKSTISLGTSHDFRIQHNGSNTELTNSTGNLTFIQHQDDGDIIFQCDDGSNGIATYFKLSGVTNKTIFQKTLNLEDSVSLYLGTGNDLQLVHDSANSKIVANGAGDLIITQGTVDQDIIFKCDDGSGGETAYITLDGSTNTVTFYKTLEIKDNVPASFGNSGDLTIKHDGSNGYMQNNTGDLTITNNTDDGDINFQSDNGSGGTATYFRLDGGFSSPFTVFPDNSTLAIGSDLDLRISHNGTDSFIDQTGTGDLYIRQKNDDKDIIFQCDDGSGGTETYFFLDGSASSGNPFTVFPDLSELAFGNSRDLRVKHDGSNSNIVNYTGNLSFTQNADDGDIVFQCDDGSGGAATYLTLDGGYSSPQIIVPDNVAFNVGSGLDFNIIHNGSNTTLTNNIGNLTILNNTDDGDIIFQSDDGSGGVETYFFLDGSASSGNPYTIFPDNSHLGFGSGYGDLQLHHNGTSSYIKNRSTGDLYIMNEADDKDIIFQSDDGSGGVTAYITLDGSTNTVTFYKTLEIKDNVPASFGNSGDLTIKHDGSNGYMQNNTGDLTITNNTDDGDINFQSDNGSGGTATYFTVDGGAVRTNFAKELRTLDDVKFKAGTSGDLEIYHDGNNSYISNIKDNSYLLFQNDDGAGGLATYFVLDGNAATHDGSATTALFTNWPDKSYISLGTGHDLQMHHNGVDTIIGNNTGDLKIRQFANDKDIVFDCDDGSGGTTTYFFLDGGLSNSGYVYTNFPDNSVLTFGTAPDLQIFHDSSNSYIQDSGTGTLYVKTNSFRVRNSGGSEDIIKALEDGAVTLYYDNAAKLATTSTGVEVTGGVSITSSAIVAVGAGFDGAETCDIQIGEVNQEIITTIQIDLGTGGATDIVSSGTAGDVIGENDTAAAYITKYDSTKNGVLYKAELICLETPVGGDTDINLVLNATSLAEDAAGETEGHVIVDGGAQTIGMRTESTASVITAAAGAHNDYIYLTHGGTTAGTYSAGKFLIRLYGAKAAL